MSDHKTKTTEEEEEEEEEEVESVSTEETPSLLSQISPAPSSSPSSTDEFLTVPHTEDTTGNPTTTTNHNRLAVGPDDILVQHEVKLQLVGSDPDESSTFKRTVSHRRSVGLVTVVEEDDSSPLMSEESSASSTPNSNNNNNLINQVCEDNAALFPVSGFESVQGRRPNMEDAHVAIDDIQKEFSDIKFTSSYYGVYDGHGGVDAAVMCEKLLHKNIITQPSFLEGDIETALKQGFAATDKTVLETSSEQNWNSGSTVVVTIVTKNKIYVGDVGDSEAVLAKRNGNTFEANLLSQKQKPNDPVEKERIKKAGGHVVFGRVMGSLAVSRAIGDRDFKFPYNKAEADFVSAEPYTAVVDRQTDCEFLVVACDGLWDKFTYQQAVDFICQEREQGRSSTEAAKNIVQSALDRGTLDNVTAIVVYLKDHSPLPKVTPKKNKGNSNESDEEDNVDLLDFLKVEAERLKSQYTNQTRLGSPKAKKLFKHFELPGEEEILQEHNCSLELLYSGLLIITQNFLCFYASTLGKKVLKKLNIYEIETIRKHKSLIFTPALTIELQDRKKYAFHWRQNTERDTAFKKILELIEQQQQPNSNTTQEKTPSSISTFESPRRRVESTDALNSHSPGEVKEIKLRDSNGAQKQADSPSPRQQRQKSSKKEEDKKLSKQSSSLSLAPNSESVSTQQVTNTVTQEQ